MHWPRDVATGAMSGILAARVERFGIEPPDLDARVSLGNTYVTDCELMDFWPDRDQFLVRIALSQRALGGRAAALSTTTAWNNTSSCASSSALQPARIVAMSQVTPPR